MTTWQGKVEGRSSKHTTLIEGHEATTLPAARGTCSIATPRLCRSTPSQPCWHSAWRSSAKYHCPTLNQCRLHTACGAKEAAQPVPWQVVRYREGEEFCTHHDVLEPRMLARMPSHQRVQQQCYYATGAADRKPWQVLTAFVYLNSLPDSRHAATADAACLTVLRTQCRWRDALPCAGLEGVCRQAEPQVSIW